MIWHRLKYINNVCLLDKVSKYLKTDGYLAFDKEKQSRNYWSVGNFQKQLYIRTYFYYVNTKSGGKCSNIRRLESFLLWMYNNGLYFKFLCICFVVLWNMDNEVVFL